MRKTQIIVFLLGLAVCELSAQSTNSALVEAKAVAYTRTLNERVGKIVATLGLSDLAKSNRVHGIIVQQYRELSKIHEERDVKLNAVKAKAAKIEPENKAAADGPVAAVRAETKSKLDQLHSDFIKQLSAELEPEQIDKVKDGMTYGVLPLTYGVYLKMFPDLTDDQKAQIKAWLTEARELAMDGSTSEEKHAVFGKYKGRINNYLVKAGYDLKQGEQNLKQATQAPAASKAN
jgi:hypothetical protein